MEPFQYLSNSHLSVLFLLLIAVPSVGASSTFIGSGSSPSIFDTDQEGSRSLPSHLRILRSKLKQIQYLIEDENFVEASGLADDIAFQMSPIPKDKDIHIIFQFVIDALSDIEPMITDIDTKRDTVHLQSALSVWHSLLASLCKKDHMHSAVIRMSHWIRLRELTLNILKGIEQKVSSGRSYQRYHEKYKELQGGMDNILLISHPENQMKLDTDPHHFWMKIMKDAATLQSVQPTMSITGVVDPYYNPMIERFYVMAIKMFIRESRSLRKAYATKKDENAFTKLFEQFEWMADYLPVPSALEYCVSLSKKAAESGDPELSEVAKFHHLVNTFYYFPLAGYRGLV